MGFLKSLALLVVIPIFGFLVSYWVFSDINSQIKSSGGDYTVSELCASESLSTEPSLEAVCDELAPVRWMQTASVISAVIAIILLSSFALFASIAGQNRTKIAKIFPALVSVTLIVLAGLVIVQGAILTYGAYTAESYAIGQVHFILIGGIGLAALIGGITLVSSSFQLLKKQVQGVLGQRLIQGDHPQLFSVVKEVADTLGAREPENIVVGLEPNFYVTNADVNLLGTEEILKGGTLFMSLSLARILTVEELKAIIGHELGHFRGEDTAYSLKFAPVYSGLTHAVDAMGANDQEKGVESLATIPALSVLSYILDVFHVNVSAVSREREFEADKAATEVAEPIALASSLLKIGLYANAWVELENKVVDRMKLGKVTKNMSQLFSSIVKYDVNEDTIPEVIESIGAETISHPTDSHPPTAARIENLGLSIDKVERDTLTLPALSAASIFGDLDSIEESLTVVQQQYYSALGVYFPDEVTSDLGSTLVAAYGAHMVVADGKVEAEEIDNAESLGLSLSKDFDYVEFREYCMYPDLLPALEDLNKFAQELESDAKQGIVKYLEGIASSDNDVSPEEQELLKAVADSLRVADTNT